MNEEATAQPWLSTLNQWYRGTLYQAIVLGIVSFS